MKPRLGFALTGSFCTFAEIMPLVRQLAERYDVIPIMSETCYNTDTRFGKAADFIDELEKICSKPVIHNIVGAEPVGPQKLLDVMVIAPCTGNTLGKLANGITDTCVTMAAKAHVRNQRPLLLGVSTNDALGNAAKNIGALLNYKHIYFVPMKQDNPADKPRSIVADFSMLEAAVQNALDNTQAQPIYL